MSEYSAIFTVPGGAPQVRSLALRAAEDVGYRVRGHGPHELKGRRQRHVLPFAGAGFELEIRLRPARIRTTLVIRGWTGGNPQHAAELRRDIDAIRERIIHSAVPD
ncbi:MAG TPA: hypothetical protein VKX16_10615 [Chloroflexota bacterium]|nr:hypothetical protein [Chloroflexota bacterium]